MTLTFPQINPIILSIDFFGMSLSLRYYSLSYIVGIIIAWWIIYKITKTEALWPNKKVELNSNSVEDLIFYLALGIVFGGRIGYVVFYQPEVIFYDPLFILQIWKGGMSFHGGFVGVIIAGVFFGYKRKIPILTLGDIIAVASPPGLFLGRIANFINGELWGTPTASFFGMLFPGRAAQDCPVYWLTICTRHPTQLYEAILEGIILGLCLFFFVFKMNGLHYRGKTVSFFLLFYGIFRFFIEFFRQADSHFITETNPYGHIVVFSNEIAQFGGISMGQLLSLPMIIVGLALLKFPIVNR